MFSTTYIDVVTELALSNPLTYSTEEPDIKIGARVVVTVSGKRHHGIVVHTHNIKPSFRVLPVREVIDHKTTLFSAHDIALWQWISSYYICSMGSVYRAAIPLSIRDNTFRDGTESHLVLKSEEPIDEILATLERQRAQMKAMLSFFEMIIPSGSIESSDLLEAAISNRSVRRSDLLKECSSGAVQSLVKRGILTQIKLRPTLAPFTPRAIELSTEDHQIVEAIELQHTTHANVLLHEKSLVDKFNIIAQLAQQTILDGRQVLILTPDGFAAERLFEQLSDFFKGGVVAYHPLMSDIKRSRSFIQAASEASIVVGSRGAVLLPMNSLGLVIIDAEHDYAYKNSESSPRLNVRDVALVKAAKASARVLLCSETPAVESYYNATRGAWGLVKTPEPVGEKVSFMVLERGKELLSKYLRTKIANAISNGQQAVVFQNRRGFSQWVECGNCFDVPTCERCNVSLTYHKTDNSLRCHYCGANETFTGSCLKCGSTNISFQGRGTERIEQSLQEIFPSAKVARLDADSTRSRGSFEEISASIATDCNIIVGTQMVIRGIDFSRVSVIGIANADNLMSQSDFRTSERAFSLLTMLSNRIGKTQGEVIIQTNKRMDHIIKSVTQRNPEAFYQADIAQRVAMNYPPAVRMISITLSHVDRDRLFGAATTFESLLRPTFGNRISPPFEPTIDRIQDRFLLGFYIRIERKRSVVKAKELINTARASIRQSNQLLKIIVDVDPW